MIIFFEKGRLGNQLFQYCAMKKYQPDGMIIAVGMRELRAGFDGIDIAGTSKCWRVLETILRLIGERPIEYAARKLRILTMVEEIRSAHGIEFGLTQGLLRNAIYFKAGFYQSEHMVGAEIARRIAPNHEAMTCAERFHASIPGDRKDRYFVHVRRGDYIKWPSSESPAVLPLQWYRQQMEQIRRTNRDALFVVVSDDKPYVEEFFSNERDVMVAHGDLMHDFAVMTGCSGGGILSASSLSWWASYFVRRANAGARFIGPKYWAGSRQRRWFPECIYTSWISYEEAF